MTLSCLDISSVVTFYISFLSTHNKQQAGIKSICTEERGKKVMTAQICVQIFVVSGPVPKENKVYSNKKNPAKMKRKKSYSNHKSEIILKVLTSGSPIHSDNDLSRI